MPSVDAQQAQPSTITGAETPVNKRTSIGLSARRPTAPATVQRPPDAGGAWSAWWLVFWVIILVIAAGFLIAARALPANTPVGSLATGSGRPVQTTAKTAALFEDAFDADSGLLPARAEPGVAAAAVLPAEGVYRLDVWPGSLAWSRFQVEGVARLRVDAAAEIDAQTPDAAVALLGRFEDDANFFLFTVDGKGRFSTARYRNGGVTVLRPPTPLPAINPAGQPNRLTLEDSGTTLRFLGNGILLDVIPVEPVITARVGIGALATSDDIVTVNFDSITVQQP